MPGLNPHRFPRRSTGDLGLEEEGQAAGDAGACAALEAVKLSTKAGGRFLGENIREVVAFVRPRWKPTWKPTWKPRKVLS